MLFLFKEGQEIYIETRDSDGEATVETVKFLREEILGGRRFIRGTAIRGENVADYLQALDDPALMSITSETRSAEE